MISKLFINPGSHVRGSLLSAWAYLLILIAIIFKEREEALLVIKHGVHCPKDSALNPPLAEETSAEVQEGLASCLEELMLLKFGACTCLKWSAALARP